MTEEPQKPRVIEPLPKRLAFRPAHVLVTRPAAAGQVSRCHCGWIPLDLTTGRPAYGTDGILMVEGHLWVMGQQGKSTLTVAPAPERESASLFHALELLEREAKDPASYTTRDFLKRIQLLRDEFLGKNDGD